jgi:hypothetical protein
MAPPSSGAGTGHEAVGPHVVDRDARAAAGRLRDVRARREVDLVVAHEGTALQADLAPPRGARAAR